MKLIFITREGHRLAGARVRCYGFAAELRQRGFETRVLSFADHLGAVDGEEESRLRLFDKIKLNYQALRELSKDKNAVFVIQRFNYHSFAPYAAHLLHRNRIILDLDDWEMRENPEYYLGFYPSSKAHFFTRYIAGKSVFCIAASRHLERFLRGVNKKVYYVPTVVDTSLFKPAEESGAAEKLVFSWCGTLNKEEHLENIAFALDCFCGLRKRYPHIYFEIAADGTHRDALVRMVDRCQDDTITLKRWIDPDAMPGYLAGVDIGLMPLVRDNNFNRAKSPTKLFEYMSMGKPTISGKTAECSSIVRDGESGLLAGTKEEFTAKMQELIDDAQLRRRMGKEARRAVEKDFSLKVAGERLSGALGLL